MSICLSVFTLVVTWSIQEGYSNESKISYFLEHQLVVMIVVIGILGYILAVSKMGVAHAELMINFTSVMMGPGIFRVFRTVRDAFTCRLWQYT